MLGGTGVHDEDLPGTALFQAGQDRNQVSRCAGRDRPADHAEAAAVWAELTWQDAQRLVRVGETGSVELPHLRWYSALAH
jgi:hypothetical protein